MLRAAAALLPALLACAAALPLQESSGPLAETEQVCVFLFRRQLGRAAASASLVFAAPQGLVQGRLRAPTADGGETQVAEYLGIPFAQPPIGAGRFAPPRPPTPVRCLRTSLLLAPCSAA